MVHTLLGNVKGADVSTVETNFAASSSSSNRHNPDFAFTPVQDAVLYAVEDLVQVICETLRHPERANFETVSGTISNRGNIPTTTTLGDQVVGALGRIYDGSDGKSCQARPLDDVQGYNNFSSSSIYTGLNPYWYALNGQQIEHTRTTVIARVCTFVRPTFGASTSLPVWDHHESALVCGAVVRLAPREGMYQQLFADCQQMWDAHLAQVRALGAQALPTELLAAPSKN